MLFYILCSNQIETELSSLLDNARVRKLALLQIAGQMPNAAYAHLLKCPRDTALLSFHN